MAQPELISVTPDALGAGPWDALIVIGRAFELTTWPNVASAVAEIRAVDRGIGDKIGVHHATGLPGNRLVLAGTGPIDADHCDVRSIGDAARAGTAAARDAGARRPLLLLEPSIYPRGFERALEVAVLEGLAGLWAPLEAREARGDAEVEPVEALGFVYGGSQADLAEVLSSLEEGRRLSRDLGGTEPERMAPIGFAEYVRDLLSPAGVQVEILDDVDALKRTYPLLMSVARASLPVPRHHPRVIRLVVEPEGEVRRTLYLAGKAVTYDTGGADLKVGGHMAGMSRDKGGGASVAGLALAAARLRPEGVRLVAEIGAVRNSVGADALVSDEIITAHSGCRVRIGNTDAEGRLVLADLLSHLRTEAMEAPMPRMFSVATLTGHAGRAVGPYSVCLDNGPARSEGVSEGLGRAGDLWADPFEISRLRREDFSFVRSRTPADDVLSSNTAPSTMTARGHQFPMAFLMVASGLEAHGREGDPPIPYTHVDIGGSFAEGGDWQHGRPTAAPVLAMAASLFEL